MPQRGFAMLKRALWAGVKPKPTRIRGVWAEVLLGSSLKNMWKLSCQHPSVQSQTDKLVKGVGRT